MAKVAADLEEGSVELDEVRAVGGVQRVDFVQQLVPLAAVEDVADLLRTRATIVSGGAGRKSWSAHLESVNLSRRLVTHAEHRAGVAFSKNSPDLRAHQRHERQHKHKRERAPRDPQC
jgi:hypothetical protein